MQRMGVSLVAALLATACGGSTEPTTKDNRPKPGQWTLVSVDGFSLPHQFGTSTIVIGSDFVQSPSYAIWGRIDVLSEPCCSFLYTADSVVSRGFNDVTNEQVTFLPLSDGRLAVTPLGGFGAADTATVNGDDEITIRMRREADSSLHDYRYTFAGPLPPP
jgi:hypothetical protein